MKKGGEDIIAEKYKTHIHLKIRAAFALTV